MKRTEAHERDRQRLRGVLRRARAHRDWCKFWQKDTSEGWSLALYWVRKDGIDRRRLRRVLRRAKGLNAENDEISAESLEYACLAGDRWCWSAAWKAAAKKWRPIAFTMHRANDVLRAERDHMQKRGAHWIAKYKEVVAERDELQRRLEEARGVLRKAEWVKHVDDEHGDEWYECPVCTEWKGDKAVHLPGCKLAAALNQQDVADKGAGVGISGKELPEGE